MADLAKPLFQFMYDIGVFDVVLPFMFVFTILFAILQKSKVFGSYGKDPKTNINAMVSFVISFFFVASLARVQLLTTIVQRVALVVVMIICVLLLTGLFGKDVRFLKFKWVYALLFITVVLIFTTALGWVELSEFGVIFEWIFHPITVMALAFFLVLWFVIREPSKGGTSKKSEKPKSPPQSGKEPEKPKAHPQSSAQSQTAPTTETGPKLVRDIPKEELYGGDDRTVWKG